MKIPRNLKPGDRCHLLGGGFVTVDPEGYNKYSFGTGLRASGYARGYSGSLVIYRLEDGAECGGDTPPIIRIERIASAPKKPAKVDKDAAWLMSHLAEPVDSPEHIAIRTGTSSSAYNKRLRTIARRLNNGAKP